MSEARKCDRCKGFYDIAEEQQDRATPYEFKGDYVNLHLWVARNGVRNDKMSQWYDLCPKCMMELENWLNNNEFPTICKPEEAGYKDPCESCHDGICEQCYYGYTDAEDKKKRWLASLKKEVEE